MAPSDKLKLVGTVLDKKYQITEILGEGGMGAVYGAKHLHLNRSCAIKVISKRHAADPIALKRFKLEAEAASTLKHPNIIDIHDFGITDDEQAYIVMERIDGQSLDDLLEQFKFLHYELAVQIFLQVCDGLAHAHERRVLHRDLKPGNIMLLKRDGGYDVKIVDFGVAKLLPGTGRTVDKLTATGEIFGSPLYMSPEQCMGQALDLRSDIYALGCVLYQTLTGKLPFVGDSLFEVVMQHVNMMPPAFAQVAPDVAIPEKLEKIVFRSISKERTLRYNSILDIKNALLQINRAGQFTEMPSSNPRPALDSAIFPDTMPGAFLNDPAKDSLDQTQKSTEDSSSSANKDSSTANNSSTGSFFADTKSDGKPLPDNSPSDADSGSSTEHKAAPIHAASDGPPAANRPLAADEFKRDWSKSFPDYCALDDSFLNDVGVDEDEIELLEELRTENAKEEYSERSIKTLGELSTVFGSRSEYDRAIVCKQKELAIIRYHFGPDTLDEAFLLETIGLYYSFLPNYEASEFCYRRSLELKREHLRDDDADIVRSLTFLANPLMSMNRLSEALELLRTARNLAEQHLGEKNLDTSEVYSLLGDCFFYEHTYAKAIEFFTKALVVKKELLGETHSQLHLILTNLGRCKYLLKQYHSAIKHCQEAIRVSDANKDMRAMAEPPYTLLMSIYGAMNDLPKAEQAGQKAIQILEEFEGIYSRDLPAVLDELAYIYEYHEMHDKSKPYRERANQIREYLSR